MILTDIAMDSAAPPTARDTRAAARSSSQSSSSSGSWESLDEDQWALLRAAARVSRSAGGAALSIAISVNISDESWSQSLNSWK